MTEINLHKPGELDVVISIPSSWNELDKEELHVISRHMLGEYEIPGTQRGAILREIISYRWKKSGQPVLKGWENKLDAENVVLDAYPLLDFLYLSNTLTRQPYPFLKPAWYKKLKGPEDEFDNMTCGEYEDTEIFFQLFRKNPGAEPLARIASILWRKPGIPYISYDYKSGRYNAYNAEKMYPLMLKLPPWILYSIFIWYSGCRETMPLYFPTAFEKTGDKEKDDDLLSFTRCIHSGAGERNGTRDKIRMMLLKEFFLDMELEARKVKELKQKQPST